MATAVLQMGDEIRLLHDEVDGLDGGKVPAGSVRLVAEPFGGGVAAHVEIIEASGYTSALIYDVPRERLVVTASSELTASS